MSDHPKKDNDAFAKELLHAREASDNGTDLMGKLLIAMPDMNDDRFHQSIILLCIHEKDAAMGFVLNKSSEVVDREKFAQQLDLSGDVSESLSVYNGGPLETRRGFVVHSTDYMQDDSVEIIEGIAVTTSKGIFRALSEGNGPKNYKFVLGYAGWSAGQLEDELQENVWLVSDPSDELIFSEDISTSVSNTSQDRDVRGRDVWGRAISNLGIDLFSFSSETGHA